MTFKPSMLQQIPTENKDIFLYNHKVIMSPKKVSIDKAMMANKKSVFKGLLGGSAG